MELLLGLDYSNCNFTYSLLGIETSTHPEDVSPLNCNFTYSLLGIETAYNCDYILMLLNCNFTYSLLGIETGKQAHKIIQAIAYCNFTYSLLGIETVSPSCCAATAIIAISLTPY